MSEIKTFEDLECWKTCRDLRVVLMRDVVKNFPREERFELTHQMKSCLRSVTANIAEGYGRYHYRENHKFCRNARGSLYEVLDHLITAADEGLIAEGTLAAARQQTANAIRLLNGYMKYLSRAGETIHEEPLQYRATPIRTRSRSSQ